MTAPTDVRHRHFVGGRWVDGVAGGRITVEDPATGDTLATVSRAEPADVDRAVAAARSCVRARALTDMRPADRGRKVVEVGRLLRARAEPLAHLLSRDSGKNLTQARMEVEGSARYFEYYGGLADKIEGRYIPLGGDYVDYVVPVPYGVSAQIIPWNYPLEMAARSLAPALAAGNAVVLKAPELDPLAVLELAAVCEEVALPDGAVNVVVGYGEDAGAALAGHADIDQIVFTGSVETGRSVLHAAAERVVPAIMELGGKSAGIVFGDADLDAVVDSTRWGIFLNSGQACNAMSRLVVQRSVADDVIDHLRTMIADLTVGPGVDDHFITPLISARQLERVDDYCASGVAAGATPVTGGHRVDDLPGHYMQPTMFRDVDPDARIAREEIFGPVLSVLTFDRPDEAVALANGTDYGLAAGVFTADLDRALWAADRLEAGQVYVNEWFAGGVETPFGGVKRSGFGREKGQEALANYHQSKNVGVRRRFDARD
jgi:acyl-CoA reductase-like NAD-dependent aldehyde dehydrogenase